VLNSKPSLPGNWPALVRKVDRAGHWRETTDDGSDAKTTSANHVFPRDDDGTVSVYLAHNSTDLERIAIGLNSRRSSLTEEIRLLVFTQAEVEAAGLTLVVSNGDTRCAHVNTLHRGIAHQSESIQSLVDALMAARRDPIRLKKSQMLAAVAAASQIGCRAVVQLETTTSCQCESTLPVAKTAVSQP
jgi:hypothetical protein